MLLLKNIIKDTDLLKMKKVIMKKVLTQKKIQEQKKIQRQKIQLMQLQKKSRQPLRQLLSLNVDL
jgi:hypothetical protein